jgi:hypothetical protein
MQAGTGRQRQAEAGIHVVRKIQGGRLVEAGRQFETGR